jgi:hypothetical protein
MRWIRLADVRCYCGQAVMHLVSKLVKMVAQTANVLIQAAAVPRAMLQQSLAPVMLTVPILRGTDHIEWIME